jgi:hypothetical protein
MSPVLQALLLFHLNLARARSQSIQSSTPSSTPSINVTSAATQSLLLQGQEETPALYHLESTRRRACRQVLYRHQFRTLRNATLIMRNSTIVPILPRICNYSNISSHSHSHNTRRATSHNSSTIDRIISTALQQRLIDFSKNFSTLANYSMYATTCLIAGLLFFLTIVLALSLNSVGILLVVECVRLYRCRARVGYQNTVPTGDANL